MVRFVMLRVALLATSVSVILASVATSCFAVCPDCNPSPCPVGCVAGECVEEYREALEERPTPDPIHWLAVDIPSACGDVTDDDGRLVRIECRNHDGVLYSYFEVIYEGGSPVRLDAHNFPNELDTVSYALTLETADGRIVGASLIDPEIIRTATFEYDGDRMVVARGVGNSSWWASQLAYSDSGALISVGTTFVDERPAYASSFRTRSTWDEAGRPLTRERFESDTGPLLDVETYVYDPADPQGKPQRHDIDEGNDGTLETVALFVYDESGELVRVHIDRAPLGSIDVDLAISDQCCGQWCVPVDGDGA